MATKFSAIYNRFLSKITDDMYSEFFTPLDTMRDLQILLLDAIDGFEFPRVILTDYTISTETISLEEVTDDMFVIEKLSDGENALVDNSSFTADLSSEEINILALLMKQGWVQRQVTSIENTRMKYSGADFKMTSQANHLAKLLVLLEESRRDSFHMQRLYRRRKVDSDGAIKPNWSTLLENRVIK